MLTEFYWHTASTSLTIWNAQSTYLPSTLTHCLSFPSLKRWQTRRTLANDQLDAQFFKNTFITVLYMFRAISCSSSGSQIVLIQHLVSSLSVSDRPVHRLRMNCVLSPVHRLRMNCVLSPVHRLRMNCVLSPEHRLRKNCVLSPEHRLRMNCVLSPEHRLRMNAVLSQPVHRTLACWVWRY